ncbi:SHOCT domain-containing protein [Streptomyces sp. NPDC052676]|uniref:SHOCT domain-containing protein n=1 Tax=Streptomyces sp. NPDC052676 TaxID=3154953 RepID=UPI003426EC0E
MQTLAHLGDAGPGAWILLTPLLWAAVMIAAITFLRRTAWRRPDALWRPASADHPSPLTILGRRFASGEIDEEEYWRRLSVLEEQFGRRGGGK